MARKRGGRKVGKPVGPLQLIVNRDAAEKAADPVVTEFVSQHGAYEPAAKTGPMRHTMQNRGGTTLDRWRRENLLSNHQEAAILHVQRLWRLTEGGARLVANLDRTVFGCPGNGNAAEIEARTDLHRIKAYFTFPLDCYYSIFENVCRFDEPAGVAGSKLAGGDRTSSRAALTVVCFVADTIYFKERLSY